MAMKIAPTPILKGEDALRFVKKIEEDLQRPAKYTQTPKIENARMLVKEYDAKFKK
jgi:hypothetical protein